MNHRPLLISLTVLLSLAAFFWLVGHWQGTAANPQVQVPMFYDEHYLYPRPWTQFQAAPGVPAPSAIALYETNQLSQPFTPGMNQLNLLRFFAQGEGELLVTLHDETGQVWQESVPLTAANQPTAVSLAFDPIPDSAGRTFWLTPSAIS
jgi:hypothetical protein